MQLTVGKLREVIKDLPDDLVVELSSDTGVDQGEGRIVVEDAYRVKYDSIDYLAIYANDHEDGYEE